jgi:hypothetical protein
MHKKKKTKYFSSGARKAKRLEDLEWKSTVTMLVSQGRKVNPTNWESHGDFFFVNGNG